MLNFFFGFRGRVRRTHFFLGSLGVLIIGAMFGAHWLHLHRDVYLSGLDYDRFDVIGSTFPPGLWIIGQLVGAACFWAGLALTVKRWHDTGASGWLVLLSLIPGVHAIVFVLLCLLPPSAGSNAYGPDPRFGAAVLA
jgi:uncharacterized membrane protein YhaH (DUF805 family)